MVKAWGKGKGWKAALEDGLREQQAAKQEDAARERMHKLATIEFFGFDEMAEEIRAALQQLEDGMTTITKAKLVADKMMGGTQSQTIEQQKANAERQLKIINELTPHEKRVPKLLDKKTRRAIAQKLGVETKHVSELIFEYQTQYAQWVWLRREQLRGHKLPDTAEELQWRMQLKPTKEYVAVMNLFFEKKRKLEKEREEQKRLPGEKKPRQTFLEKQQERFGIPS